jgi:hypothetical protein
VFELAGRGDEAKASMEESVENAERYGHLVAAEKARDRLAAARDQPWSSAANTLQARRTWATMPPKNSAMPPMSHGRGLRC